MNATNKKIGRPTASPKNTMIRVRMDDNTLQQMDECAKELSTSRSEVIRLGIKELHQKLRK